MFVHHFLYQHNCNFCGNNMSKYGSGFVPSTPVTNSQIVLPIFAEGSLSNQLLYLYLYQYLHLYINLIYISISIYLYLYISISIIIYIYISVSLHLYLYLCLLSVISTGTSPEEITASRPLNKISPVP